MERIAIVGASLAGLRAAQELRRRGFAGSIRLIGAEPELPYDRPPLSKQVLAGEWEPARAMLVDRTTLRGDDIEISTDTEVTGLDVARRRLSTGHDEIDFDGLVIATGARPRRLPTVTPAGVHELRTLADARGLLADLGDGPKAVVVVGAGFIGAEVAATCRSQGHRVTIVEVAPAPMERAIGAEMGAVMADLHRLHGVDVRLGVAVARFVGDEHIAGVELDDGSTLEAEVVVVGIGVVPNTEWLEGSGLVIDNGVVCDATLLAAPGVVAAGDVARWPNLLFDETMRIEHWDNAGDQAGAAARRLLAAPTEAEPFTPVPWFWSDQYDRKVQVAGRTNDADEVVVAHGAVDAGRFVALYRRGERLAGAFGMNRPRHVIQLRTLIAERGSFAEAVDRLSD
jgi:3-phenylpropionate/trans-cinnamate dioxygenase ferredoxin reductase subunit